MKGPVHVFFSDTGDKILENKTLDQSDAFSNEDNIAYSSFYDMVDYILLSEGQYGAEDYITNYFGGWTRYDWGDHTFWWWNTPRNGGMGLQKYEPFSCIVSDLNYITSSLGAPKSEESIWDEVYHGYWITCTWNNEAPRKDTVKTFWWGE